MNNALKTFVFYSKLLTIAVLMLFLQLLNLDELRAQQTGINHIIILDKTASMKGGGEVDSENIWPEVQKNLFNYIDNDLEPGDSIKIIQYAHHVEEAKSWGITDNFSGDKVKNFIKNIQLDGKWTCTYDALMEAVKRIKKNKDLINKIYLVTDGINSGLDHCQGTMGDAIDTFNLKKGEYDKLYYVSSGEEIPNEVNRESKSNDDFEVIDNPEGEANLPVTIIPRADSLHFTMKNTALNQGFRILNKDRLPEDFRLSVQRFHLNSLSNTMHDPELKPQSFKPHGITTFKISFLNEGVPEGYYSGYLTLEAEDNKNVVVGVNPSKIDVSFSNIKKQVLKIGFPDSREEKYLTKFDTGVYKFSFQFNQKTLEENTDLIFLIKGDLNKTNIEPGAGKIKNGRWILKPSSLEEERGLLDKYEVPLKVFSKKPFMEGSNYIKLQLDRRVEQKKNVKIEYLNEGKEFWQIKSLEFYKPTPVWKQVLYILGGFAILTMALWFLWLRNKLFPPMTGKLKFDGEPGEIRLKGLKGLVLSGGEGPKNRNGGLLKKLFVGKVKTVNLSDAPEQFYDNPGYVEIRPKKRKGQLWNIMKSHDCEVDPPDKYLTHDTQYTIYFDKDGNNLNKSFIYDNIKHIN